MKRTRSPDVEVFSELGSLKAGERVSLTCQDNAKGEHTGIIAIKPAKPAATKSK